MLRFLLLLGVSFFSVVTITPVVAAAAADDSADDCVPGIAVDPASLANLTAQARIGNLTAWPDVFRLTSPDPSDPTLPNEAITDDDNDALGPEILIQAGVEYRYLDPTGYTYPNATKAIPWSPPANGTNDPALQQLREAQDYQYADIVVVTGYMDKFYEEHIHAGGDEVRYILDGSGYFDIRDVNDEWVRVHAQAGDFIVFPSGIDHRFSVDENNYIQAMRLFQGSDDPDWSSVARTNQTDNASRQQYVDTYLCGIEPSSSSDSEDDSHDHSSHVHDLTPAETAPPDDAEAEVNSAASARTRLGSSRMRMTMLIISSISIAATTTSL